LCPLILDVTLSLVADRQVLNDEPNFKSCKNTGSPKAYGYFIGERGEQSRKIYASHAPLPDKPESSPTVGDIFRK
jgi:hypothetical protein